MTHSSHAYRLPIISTEKANTILKLASCRETLFFSSIFLGRFLICFGYWTRIISDGDRDNVPQLKKWLNHIGNLSVHGKSAEEADRREQPYPAKAGSRMGTFRVGWTRT
ncbi:hypothetical protein BDV23DRAFT_99914 [Aspergillus alliaceus]|uniref:Uncharacterized protein n=1 Tax=Petromyces alliaceus TaxID=209559 RepID=A0A5N7C560_PETAA|nr:hypothetical protein BDV23DRAFT_99914 [Aspergillus alliaceus]